MIIICTVLYGLETYILLVSDSQQRSFHSHAGVLIAAQEYIL